MQLRAGREVHKRAVTLGLMAAALLVFLAVANLPASQALAEGERREVLTINVAGDNCFPPYEFVSDTGVYRGFNVDLMNAIAIELGVNIELHPMPWFRVREALEKGEVDAVQGMKYSAERDKVYDFSTPYLTSAQAIFVRKSCMDIADVTDLEGRRVAVQQGDIAYEFLKKAMGIHLVVFENQRSALEALLAGNVDAFVGNRLAGVYMVQRKMRTGEVKVVGSPIDPAPYCVAVREGDTRLLELLNKGIAGIKKSGSYDKIYRKWFGEEIEPPSVFLKQLMRILWTVLGILAAGALAVVNWNRALRQQVAARTRQLAQVNALQKLILENSFNAIVALDRHGRVVAGNASAARFCAPQEEELVGRHWKETLLGRFLPEEMFVKASRDGAVYRDREAVVELDGEERVVGFNLGPLDDGAGSSGAVLVFRDITDSKKLRAAEAIRDKMEAFTRLVAGIAHEVRNPLTSIKTFIQLLPSKYDDPEFREQLARHLPTEVDRLTTIISELLQYARPRRPFKERFDVGELVGSVVSVFRFHAMRAGIDLTSDVPTGMMVLADRNQVKQVLINVILNAIEAVSGPGSVRVSASDGRDGYVRVTVADSGPGIAKEDLARVFEPFFTKKPKGTGLGLSLSYQLMKENGGDIRIESFPGEGTRVILLLPAVTGDAPPLGKEVPT